MDSALRRRVEGFWDVDDQLARGRNSVSPAKRPDHTPELPLSEWKTLYLRKLVKSVFSVLLTAICVVFNVCCTIAASGQ